MAAAIILIPEMLSGPRRARTATAQTPTAEAPMKTYTIDLNRSPGAPTSPAEVDERAPPSESVSPVEGSAEQATAASSEKGPPEASTPAPQAIPESTQPRNPERIASEQAPRPAVEPPPPVQSAPPPREASAPTPVVTASSVPTSRGWAVQLGSFASRATADRMVKDLAQKGQKAFVMPVKSGSNTLYRVRVGPFADRDAANDALRDVKGQVANAAVVAHP